MSKGRGMRVATPASDCRWGSPINISIALKITLWTKQNLTPWSKNKMVPVFKMDPGIQLVVLTAVLGTVLTCTHDHTAFFEGSKTKTSRSPPKPKHSRASLPGLDSPSHTAFTNERLNFNMITSKMNSCLEVNIRPHNLTARSAWASLSTFKLHPGIRRELELVSRSLF